MTYSLDFRGHILGYKRKYKLSYEATAKHFEVGKASLVRWSKRLMPKLKRNKPATKIDMSQLTQDIQAYPSASLVERASRFDVSDSAIFYALKRLKISYKKNILSPESG